MPGMEGPPSITALRARLPQTPVVVLSGYADHDTMLACFGAGAAGFIPKTMGQAEMVSALRFVLDGQRFVPASFVEQELMPRAGPQPAGSVAGERNLPPRDLTAREIELLKHLANGRKNKEIARVLGLEEVTIKFALRRLYKKINASNRASAVRLAIQGGLV